MFRATMCPSSGELAVSMRHLVYVTLCGRPSGMQVATCIPDGHPHRVTYTRCRIDIIDSPDDGHIVDFRTTIIVQTCFGLHEPSSGSSQSVLRQSYNIDFSVYMSIM